MRYRQPLQCFSSSNDSDVGLDIESCFDIEDTQDDTDTEPNDAHNVDKEGDFDEEDLLDLE